MQRPFVSIKGVLLKIARDLNLGETEIPWQDMVEWCAEAMQHIGAYAQLEEKVATLEVEDYRAKLPDDFYSIRQNVGLQYKLQGDSLIVGLRTGHVTNFHYLAYQVDEEGYPLIPDHISYSTALFWKVAMQLAIRGELRNKELSLAYCQNRWNKYCAQAGAYGNLMTPDGAQRFARFFTSRIPDLHQYQQGFTGLTGTLPSGV